MSADPQRLATLRSDWSRVARWMRHTGDPSARRRLSASLTALELEGAAVAAELGQESERAEYEIYQQAEHGSKPDPWRTIKGREQWACSTCDEQIEKGEVHEIRSYRVAGEGKVVERRCDSCTRSPDYAITAHHQRGDRK